MMSLAALVLALAQDFDQALTRGDELMAEAKALYEDATRRNSVDAFNDAAFKLEEAKLKFLAVQELATGDKQKAASEKLRTAQQLARLIGDGKKKAMAPPPTPAPSPAAPPTDAAPPAAPATPPPATLAAATKPSKQPIPEAEAQRDAEKNVRELFKSEYAKKDAASKKVLARSLLEQATRGGDPPAIVWVLAREARDLGVQSGDADVALQAAELAASVFEVGAPTMKLEVLGAVAKTAKTPADHRVLAERAAALAERAVEAESFEQANKALQLASASARRANDAALTSRISAQAKDVADLKTLSAAAYRARETLQSNATDAAACLEFGRYLCLIKGEWPAGLPLLVRGADAALKALAEKELTFPAAGSELVLLGDGWWDVADKLKPSALKTAARAHACEIYERALEGTSGVLRARLEKRLAEAAGPVDLLRLIDPEKDAVKGNWVVSGDGLSTKEMVSMARCQIPYHPPEEYDLSLVVTRHEGEGSVHINLAAGGAKFHVYLDAYGRSASGIGMIDNKGPNQNETKVNGLLLKDGQASTVLCSVRRQSLTVTVDGRKVIDYKGGWGRLSEVDILKMPDRKALGVAAHSGRVVFSKITLVAVSGLGRKAR